MKHWFYFYVEMSAFRIFAFAIFKKIPYWGCMGKNEGSLHEIASRKILGVYEHNYNHNILYLFD